jgi:transcriptional regulator with XRE-family HTH domain
METKKFIKAKQTVNQLLIIAREEAGLTQKQVSNSGLVSQSELSKIENGYRQISFDLVITLAELYKKDIKYFIPKEK